MTRAEFLGKLLMAETLRRAGERAEYWSGYKRGLRRRFHGERFGTAAEHEKWMGLADDEDESRRERGQGYRDGFNAAAETLAQKKGAG